MSEVNWMAALAGLGMFLFGMLVLEGAIKTAAGARFKTLLRKSTDTIGKSVFTGGVATAVLQSSTLVSLMVLAFVGAGIMTLQSGIGVMFGANIGSTGVSWIVALLGFKVKVDSFAMPMIGIGGLGLLFAGQSRKAHAFFSMLMGFGLLFFGLEMMKQSMDHVAEHVDLEDFRAYGLLAYVGMGFLLTVIINSSAASMAIFLTALGAGVIDFTTATALVIGANVGTTGTIVLSALGGTPDKKRVASAHVLFNVLTGVIALILLAPMNWLILDVMGMSGDPVLGLAIFHTLFNVMGVALFTATIPMLALWLGRRFTRTEVKITKHIDSVSPQIAEASVVALKNEALHLLKEVMRFSLVMFNIPPKEVFSLKRKTTAIVYSSQGILDVNVDEQYARLKKLEAAMLEYATRVGDRSPEDEAVLNHALAAAREATYAAKVIKDIKHNLDEFAVSEDDFMLDHYNQARLRVADLYKYLLMAMDAGATGATDILQNLEKVFQEIKNEDASTLKNISRAIKSGDIAQHNSPAFISINRGVVNASDSLVEAAKLLFLSEHQSAAKHEGNPGAPTHGDNA
ncbi:MAG: Na/Pi cotransporter family protein [Campylobacterales bacterium]